MMKMRTAPGGTDGVRGDEACGMAGELPIPGLLPAPWQRPGPWQGLVLPTFVYDLYLCREIHARCGAVE